MATSPAKDSENSPRQLTDSLWVFPPEKASEEGASWWLDCKPEPVLIDCPPITTKTIGALKRISHGQRARILLTNRGGHGRVRELQRAFGWPILVQEQEAYLLPDLKNVETFEETHTTQSGLRILWTPGPSPGSCVIHAPSPWNVLFCGRLLTPVEVDRLAGSRDFCTFHWPRHQKSIEKLRQWLPQEARPSLASWRVVAPLKSIGLAPWHAWQNTYTDHVNLSK